MVGGALISLSLLAGASLIEFLPEAQPARRLVQLGDLADLSALPMELRDPAHRLEILSVPDQTMEMSIQSRDISARARSLMPILANWLPKTSSEVKISFRSFDPRPAIKASGSELGIKKGEAVTFTVKSGIFEIARTRIAMEAVRLGNKFFVRTTDRKPVSVLCCEVDR